MFGADPGIDGCLLELEEIMKLQRSESLVATLLVKSADSVASYGNDIVLTPNDLRALCQWTFDERNLRPMVSLLAGDWHLILLPSGFDVADVVLVSHTGNQLKIYLIQVTRSSDPFSKHHTNETCSEKSKKRLENLQSTILSQFSCCSVNLVQEVIFDMLAPNCEAIKFVAHPTQSLPYYFSLKNVVSLYHG